MCQIFWEVVGLERGPLSLVRIIEELLERKSSGSGQECRINGRGDPLRWPRDTLYPQKLALTSPTSGGRSVGIVRLRTKDHGVLYYYYYYYYYILFLCVLFLFFTRSHFVIGLWPIKFACKSIIIELFELLCPLGLHWQSGCGVQPAAWILCALYRG
jgi:hypothetical protein